MSKNQLIDELFEIFDSIVERSFKNKATFQSMLEKFPSNEQVATFDLIDIQQYEDQSRSALKQYSIEQLQYFIEEAQTTLDNIMSEELNIQKLAIKINKSPISPSRNYQQESWEFLLQWPKSKNIDSIINSVKSITNQLANQIQRSVFLNKIGEYEGTDDLQDKYNQALLKIKELESQQQYIQQFPISYKQQQQQQQEQQSSSKSNSKSKPKERMDLINELEQKLEELEYEKDQTQVISMDAFSHILSLRL